MPHVRTPEFAVDVPAYTAGSDAALVEAGRRLSQFWEWSMALPDSLDDATDDATEKAEDAAHSAINAALEDFLIKTPAHGAAGILAKYELLREMEGINGSGSTSWVRTEEMDRSILEALRRLATN
jgi:hypothetical protein